MSAARRHKKHHHEEHENHERWLVSGYDMMTLLFAVFVVLFAISSTNVSKVKALQQSLQEAFSGPVLSGGQAMMQTRRPVRGRARRADAAAAVDLARRRPSRPRCRTDASARPPTATRRGAKLAARRSRTSRRSSAASTRCVKEAGLGDKVSTTVSAARPEGPPAHRQAASSTRAAPSINAGRAPDARPDRRRSSPTSASTRSQVEGHTDDRPIATSQFPSNWQLSGAPRRAPSCSASSAPASAPGACRSAATRREHPVASERDRRRTGAEPPGRDRPDPAAWSNHVAWRRRLMNKKIIIIVVVAARRRGRRLQVRPGQAEGEGAEAEGRRHGLRAPEGVPGQPRRRPLRQGAGRRSSLEGPLGRRGRRPRRARRRPRATAPSPRRRSSATSSPTS